MTLLKKYADLAVKTGINVQKGQTLMINVAAEHYEFARLLTQSAYEAGAGKVVIKWSDDHITKMGYQNRSLESLTTIPSWLIEEYDDLMEENFARLSIYAPSPGLMADVDGDKIAAASKAT